jgi:hypothetical protein
VETTSIWHWLIIALWVGILVPPIAKILHRAGYSRWWAVVALLPLLNLIGLWVFAFSKWPVTAKDKPTQDKWSDAEREHFNELLRKR